MTQSWKVENFLEINNGILRIDHIDATELAREYGTPLFVVSEKQLHSNIERLLKIREVIDRPLKISYAAKAMSTMGILRSVREAGIDIEVNSGGELWKALKAGFRGDQINFNGNSKEVWELELAITNEIYAIQVDSLYELSLIAETAERLGKRANVSLRLVPEIESHTHSGLQTALLTSKFGMMPNEAYEAFRQYKDSPHIAMTGIHLHVGSQNPDPQVYTDAFLSLFESLKLIRKETGLKLQHVNIGGGFPVNYIGDEAVEGIPTEINEMLSATFEPADAIRDAWAAVQDSAAGTDLLDDITILIEPGRSIIADTTICLTTVRNTKSRPVSESKIQNPESTIDNWLLTDAGFNILLSMETYKWYYHLISATRPNEPHDTPYKVAGPLCDGGDVYFDIEGQNRLPDHRMLPDNVKPGEVLALLNCGAYSLSQASQYNGRFLPPVVLIRENGELELIRRRDTFADLINNDI
ncbi:MAG TPA: diaminopimelate decarboxylase [Pyrinomonadaceae bacterium]|nr:diaminopimelate decarboxylase [Pyrinomonadaceae bacterium]